VALTKAGANRTIGIQLDSIVCHGTRCHLFALGPATVPAIGILKNKTAQLPIVAAGRVRHI
jgi:hypothetical protein